MFKLILETAEEPEIKLPTSAGSWKKQESSRKPSISALLTMPKLSTVWITIINWKILQEMGIPDHLTCPLRNLYAGQKETERDMEQQTGSKLGKEYVKAVYCHLCAEYIMQNAGLGKAQAGIKIARRKISVTSDTQMTPPLWEKAKRN